jgi:hypothetical protein
MRNAQKNAVTVVESTQNGKLVGKSEVYNWATTYTEVGPTCPRECWFHPDSIYADKLKALQLKACYTKRGHVSFSVAANKFAGADVSETAMIPIKAQFDRIFVMHQAGRKIVDGLRWQTGGDILHPITGEPWKEYIDLILYVTGRCVELGIPVIGFTATWRHPDVQVLRGKFHASVQTFQDAKYATDLGWTVAYAVKDILVPIAVEELRQLGQRAVFCPEQAGKATSCSDCGWCAVADSSKLHEVPGESKYMQYRKRFATIDIPGSIVLKNH